VTSNICIAAGEPLFTQEIAGVLTRLPGISASDLPHILPQDRGYLAAEMTAFLLSWLDQLPCPKLNRPGANGLNGPFLRLQEWHYLAAQRGIPVVPLQQHISYQKDPIQHHHADAATVVIVGDEHVGNLHPQLVTYAHTLGDAVGVELFAAQFTHADADAQLIAVDLLPPLSEAVIKAIGGYFAERHVAHDTEVRRAWA